VSIFAGQLMTIWVGAEYADLAPLMVIVTVGCLFLVQSSCCASINAAYLRVRMPAYANLVGGGINISLALLLSPYIGIYGVALATTVASFFISGFFSPMYGAHILKKPIFTFMKPAFAGYAIFCILLICGYVFTSIVTVNGIITTCMSGGLFAIVYCIIIWFVIMKKEERVLLLTIIPPAISKFIPKPIRNF